MNQPVCLCCEKEVIPLIDFGATPLANTYGISQKFSLALNRCISCFHLQLAETVDPEVLFKNYLYCSGTGRTAQDFFTEFAWMAVRDYHPSAQHVLDIACNDGSQLDAFNKMGLRTYGVDPAENLAMACGDKGHNVRCCFFEESEWDYGRTFDLITAQNVVAHTPTPLKFLQKCSSLMHESSRLLIATSQANMIVSGQCDAIYHEHVSYFNIYSMRTLARRAGLTIVDVVMHPIHGTSYIFVLGKEGRESNNVDDRAEWEAVVGMISQPLYRWWKAHVQQKISKLKTTIEDYSSRGYLTIGCGAAAKGISMLNMADTKLDMLADSTPLKWHKYASDMPIVPFEHIKTIEREKVLFVILPWNLRNEIKSNVLKLRDNSRDIFIETR